jgi:hypothetical protein
LDEDGSAVSAVSEEESSGNNICISLKAYLLFGIGNTGNAEGERKD